MRAERIRQVLKPFVIGTGLLFIVAGLFDARLEDRFVHYPRAAVGENMIAYRWKSTVVYITPSDNEELAAEHAAFAVFALTAVPWFVACAFARKRTG